MKEILAAVPSPSKRVLLLRHPLLWILLVGLLAMGGALKADFYMDDYGFILNRNGDAPVTFNLPLAGHLYGSTAPDSREVTIFQLLPTLMTALTNHLFPMNPTAAHVWNLIIHLTLSLMIFGLGRRCLGQMQVLGSRQAREQAALVGALLFACHPLGTEPVHYAKCHMVQLVAMFGFWATCEAVSFLDTPNKRTGLRLLLASFLCMLSYFPGTVLLGFNLLVVAVFKLRGKQTEKWTFSLSFQAALRRPAVIGGLLLLFGLGIYAISFFLPRFYASMTAWGDFSNMHIATQGRVFWEYVQRLLVPIALSSDHYQPWSTFRHSEAVLKLMLMAGLLFAGIALAMGRRFGAKRGLGLLLLLALIPFSIRLLYVNAEIMVEYRAYSALPWAGLLAGCGLTALADHLARRGVLHLRWVPSAAIILIFTLLSAARGTIWQSSIALAEDALSQYPLNNRPRNQLQYYNFHAGRYAAVLELHLEALGILSKIDAANAQTKGTVLIDCLRANTNVISSFQLAIYSRAELEGRLKALAFADQSITSLKAVRPEWFVVGPGNPKTFMWPVAEARAAVNRMQFPEMR